MTKEVWIYLFAFCVCYDSTIGNSDAVQVLTCDECNFTRYIEENVTVGTDVFFLPIGNFSHVTNVSIESGNLNDRFSVNQSGVVYVAKLLDYGMKSEYSLHIAVTKEDNTYDTALLTVVVTDVEDWPPVFNQSCFWHAGSESPDALLYELYGGQGDDLKPIEELVLFKDADDMKQFFNVDSDNSQCNSIIYLASHHGKMGIVTLQQFRLHCGQELRTGVTAQILTPDDSALDGNPYINRSWFEEPQDADMVVIINLAHMVNEIDSGVCDVVFVPFGTALLTLSTKIVPQGCPTGKYGFKCDQDCICLNGASCHPFNGACQCTNGWTGPACDIEISRIEISPKTSYSVYGGLLTVLCYTYNIQISDRHKDITWYLNNSAITGNDQRFYVHSSKEGYSTLSSKYVVDNFTGQYKCQVIDIDGRIHTAHGQVIVTGCADNRWGRTCEHYCDCQNSAPCNREKGCLCLPGWNGTTCSHDIQKPSIKDCPSDIVLSPGKDVRNFTVTWKEPIISDNSKHLNVTSNFHPGQQFDYGVHTVIYRAVDEGDNVATCVFSVTVNKPEGVLSTPVISVLAILAFLICVLCVIGPYLGYKYRHEIQTIIAEKFQPYEDDDGRRYDAFVSVKGDTDDEIFVYRILLPTLEKQYGFKLCVHHRDFIIGEAIVENIIMSIKDSRRTILILSPAFVDSEWCDYEVLMAHKEMVGLRQKLIPLMFEDISQMANIRPSLQAILNTITYIEWPKGNEEKDVEKFWKRLVKAMPRKRKPQDPNQNEEQPESPARQNSPDTFSSFTKFLRNFWPKKETSGSDILNDVIGDDAPLILQEDHVA